jgi:glyoxylase-like metal-dependent hydrolase (beta-lactamase superfamily II)
VEPEVYVFYEPGQFEEAISYLVLGVGEGRRLIDTGCGIGDIRALSREFTDLPIMVVNTHHHIDHVAQDYLFDDVAIFDHPMARAAAERGYTHEEGRPAPIRGGLSGGPLPEGFDPEAYRVPPFRVTRWLRDGDIIDLGGEEAGGYSYPPATPPDSICLLDRGVPPPLGPGTPSTQAPYTHICLGETWRGLLRAIGG